MTKFYYDILTITVQKFNPIGSVIFKWLTAKTHNMHTDTIPFSYITDDLIILFLMAAVHLKQTLNLNMYVFLKLTSYNQSLRLITTHSIRELGGINQNYILYHKYFYFYVQSRDQRLSPILSKQYLICSKFAYGYVFCW